MHKLLKKLSLHNFDLNTGQSLFEVVFALGIAAILLTGVVSLSSTGVKNTTSTKNNFLATQYGSEGLEWVRKERDRMGWDAFSVSVDANPVVCLITLAWPPLNPDKDCLETDYVSNSNPPNVFRRHLNLTPISATDIEATVTVAWNEGGGTRTTVSTTHLTDWRSWAAYLPLPTPTPLTANTKPVANLLPTSAGSSLLRSVNVNFIGSGSDSDGNVVSYVLNFLDGTPNYTGTNSSPTVTVNAPTHLYKNCIPAGQPGAHSCYVPATGYCTCMARFQVTDDDGATSEYPPNGIRPVHFRQCSQAGGACITTNDCCDNGADIMNCNVGGFCEIVG